MNEQEIIFQKYARELLSLPNIRVVDVSDGDRTSKEFISKMGKPSLRVTLYLWRKGASFVGLDIEGTNTGYWHTAEEIDLDYHMKLAKAALKGDFAYNKSPLLRLNEICFKSESAWHCTRTNQNSSYHYIKLRNDI